MYKNIENIIEDNSMEYSAYVLTNRAIPDLRDSCKPVTRRIIYSMYREKATKFCKSATMSGKVMALHPHSDCYPTMVGMVQRDNQLLPWLEGKGNFSQHTSRDLMYASSRYSEVKLSPFTINVLKDLNDKSVKYIPNYDGTIMMPEVLPVKFPMILHYCQSGIGVGMASNIPSFNMIEIADAIELYIKNGKETNLIPDFATGGHIIDDKSNIEKINKTGIGSVTLRGNTIIQDNVITINEIPYSTTREAIIDKVIELIKNGKLKEISNINDLTGLNGMCIEITCKKNADINLVIQKLYKNTPLQSTFSANMNVLSKGLPKVMGTWDIIKEWLDWRKECICLTYEEDVKNLKKQLHLYQGLIKIIDFIDEVIDIIKNSDNDDEMVELLCKRFDIDKTQAEYISEIKIKNLNKVHINKTIKDKKELEDKIKKLTDILNNDNSIMNVIVDEIKLTAKNYGQPRRTSIIYQDQLQEISSDQLIDDYSTYIVLTKENYLKKLLRKTDTVKLKDGDAIIYQTSSSNKSTLLLFSNKGVCYKIYQHEINECKPSELGLYLPTHLELEKDERIISMINTRKYEGFLLSVFESGKVAKVNLTSFKTQTMRSKLQNALNIDSPLVKMFVLEKDTDLLLMSDIDKVLITSSENINSKDSKNTMGVQVMKSKKDSKVVMCELLENIDTDKIEDINYYKGNTNSIGTFLKKSDTITIK